MHLHAQQYISKLLKGPYFLVAWLIARNKDVNIEDYSVMLLNSTLKEFYAEVRNTEGHRCMLKVHMLASGIRASITRYLRAVPFNKPFQSYLTKNSKRLTRCF
jgi:hypothetical protein